MLDFSSVNIGNESDVVEIIEKEGCLCFTVADGKGFFKTPHILIDSIKENLEDNSEISAEPLRKILNEAQAKAETEVAEGCSAAVMISDGDVGIWGHIGDCRVYHLKEKLLYEITPDHSEAYYRYEAGDIRYPKIRKDRNRRKITRMLGARQDFRPTYSRPEIIKSEDNILICSDGFWENIHERQIEKTLNRSKNAEDWLNRMVKIIEKNRKRKKYTRIKDDYSAITISFKE